MKKLITITLSLLLIMSFAVPTFAKSEYQEITKNQFVELLKSYDLTYVSIEHYGPGQFDKYTDLIFFNKKNGYSFVIEGVMSGKIIDEFGNLYRTLHLANWYKKSESLYRVEGVFVPGELLEFISNEIPFK